MEFKLKLNFHKLCGKTQKNFLANPIFNLSESPAMQETTVRFLGWEFPLEKGWVPMPLFLASLVAQRVKGLFLGLPWWLRW